MYEFVINDLKNFVEIFWKRNDIDIQNFDYYKGFTYVLMQMYKKSNYQEAKDELMSYLEHPDDDWKYYFVNLMISLMKNDTSIPEYDRDCLKICKFRSDLPNAIVQIKKCHNAFTFAADLATDIYQETIKNYKNTRQKRITNLLESCYGDEYKELYKKFEKHENILNEFYKSLDKTHKTNNSACPVQVMNVYKTHKFKYKWQLYVLWLEYEENKKEFINKFV
jgi:hypothetical protein